MLRLVSRCKARCARGGLVTAADSSSHEPQHARTAIGGPSHCRASWSLLLSVARADGAGRSEGGVCTSALEPFLPAARLACAPRVDWRPCQLRVVGALPKMRVPSLCVSTNAAPRAESPRSGAVTRV